MGEQVEAWLAARDPVPELEILTVREPEPQGTGGAVAFCRPQLRSDPGLVLNGDTFVETGVESFLAARRGSGAGAGPGFPPGGGAGGPRGGGRTGRDPPPPVLQ